MLVRSATFLPYGNPKNCLARFWYIFLNLIATNMLYPTTSSVVHDLWEAMLVDVRKNMLDTSLLDCCYVSRFLVVFQNVLSYQQLLGEAMLVVFKKVWGYQQLLGEAMLVVFRMGPKKEDRMNDNHFFWQLKTNNLTDEIRTNITMTSFRSWWRPLTMFITRKYISGIDSPKKASGLWFDQKIILWRLLHGVL